MVVMANTAHTQGIILAGVHAWGESLLEQICCRPLLPVLGRPLVWYVLDWLGRGGIARASICANSDTGIFRHCLGTGSVAEVGLSYYADLMPRGPAGCMRDAADGNCADTFVVVDATIVTRVDLGDLLAAHRASRAVLTVVVEQEPNTATVEPMGIYVVSRAALDCVPAKGYQDIKEVLIPRLYDAGQYVAPYVAKAGDTLRVTSAASCLSVLGRVLREPWRLPGPYNQIGTARVHVTSYVARSARLIGPVVVGPNCAIEEGATVLGPTAIGPDTIIGRDAVVSRTSVWPGCHIGPGAFIDHSILTSSSRIDGHMTVRDTVHIPHSQPARLSTDALYWGLAHEPAVDPHEQEMLGTLDDLSQRLQGASLREQAGVRQDPPILHNRPYRGEPARDRA